MDNEKLIIIKSLAKCDEDDVLRSYLQQGGSPVGDIIQVGMMLKSGEHKITVIKKLQEATGLTLVECKKIIDTEIQNEVAKVLTK